MDWNLLLKDSKDSLYLNILMLLLAAAVLLKGRHHGNRKQLLLVLHASATLLQAAAVSVLFLKTFVRNYHLSLLVANVSQTIFALIELLLCSLYISNHIHNRLLKKIILGTTAAVEVIIGLAFAQAPARAGITNNIFVIENISITLFGCFYIFDLANQPAGGHLTRRPAYWAIMGMFITFSVGTILFLFMNVLDYSYVHSTIYFINFLLYCLLFGAYLQALRVARLPVVEEDNIT